jgi:tetratricopeptide (TPR) repeat protein
VAGSQKGSPEIGGSLRDADDNGGGGNGGGGNNGGGNNGNNDGDDNRTIIYCYCCGHPWWDCPWCRYWSPVCWSYCGYDWYFWGSYWRPGWDACFIEFHNTYNFSNHYPSIYTAPALTIDPTSRAIEYLDQGAALFREGRYQESLRYFRLAHLADLNFAIPRFAYAHVLFALGLYDFTAEEIRLGLALLPEWVDMGGNMKLMYGEEQDFDDQFSSLFAHLKVFPNDEKALLVLGYVSYFTGDLYLAEKAFDHLSRSPDAGISVTAELFRSAVSRVKDRLLAAGKKDHALLTDDGVTVGDILQR